MVCPAIARTNWAREFDLWRPGAAVKIMLQVEEIGYRCPITICSYDFLRSHQAALAALRYDLVILDEAQRVKTHTALQTQAMFGTEGVARSSQRVWWLTGTPMENHPGELWLPFFFARKTSLTYNKWVSKFCTFYRGPEGLRITGTQKEGIPELQRLIRESGFVLRRLKRDVLKDLPPMRVVRTPIEGTVPAMHDLYDEFGEESINVLDKIAMERELLAHALGEATALNKDLLAVLQGMAESVSTLRRYVGLQKVPGVAALAAQELEADMYPNLFIVTAHTGTAYSLAKLLGRFGVGVITGETPPARRQEIIDRFVAGELRVLIGQIIACGTAITLHGGGKCSNVIVAETIWDPGSLRQVLDRVHRIGQSKAVLARIAELQDDPIDRAVLGTIERKAREISNVLDGAERGIVTTLADWLVSE